MPENLNGGGTETLDMGGIVIATGMETRPGFCARYRRVRVRVPIIVPSATRTCIYPDPYPSTQVEYWLTNKKKNYTST